MEIFLAPTNYYWKWMLTYAASINALSTQSIRKYFVSFPIKMVLENNCNFQFVNLFVHLEKHPAINLKKNKKKSVETNQSFH